MSGTLLLSEQVTWMPTNSIFSRVVRDVAEQLRLDDPALALVLHDGQTDITGFVDLRELSRDRVHSLLDAVSRAFEQALRDGPATATSSLDFASLMWRFSELKALARSDSRAIPTGHSERGRLVLSPSGVWTGPTWLYEMALEQVATQILADDKALAHMLLGARTSRGHTTCDLQTVSARRLRPIRLQTEFFFAKYRHAPDGNAVEVYEHVLAAYDELLRLLLTDARAWPHHDVAIRLALATQQLMGERAQRWRVEDGGRFRPEAFWIHVWSRSRAALGTEIPPSGCFFFGPPNGDQTTIYRLEWDPTGGGSEALVRDAIAELAGAQSRA